MFDQLRDRLDKVFTTLTGRGALSEKDVDVALREIRRVLLEADVALDVVRSFIATVRERAVGADIIKSVSPGQMVIKIVHDVLIDTLGQTQIPLNILGPAPAVIMMVGLQGSGKTTTAAKIAHRLKHKQKKKALMASLDIYRPAAQAQLAVLGEQIEVATLPVIDGQKPLAITERALNAARLGGYDVLILDTAGRTHIDDVMMQEAEAIKKLASPTETLLVADALTGQDAVNVARRFNEQIDITGIALTRIDGDGRGGAALAMRAVTGKPIKLMGVGEKWDALEDFHPDRISDRILGMGDVVSLVEKAAETVNEDQAARMARRMQKGVFDLNDLAAQLKQMQKMGGMGQLLGMLPGMSKFKDIAVQKGLEDTAIKRQVAMIQSMTKQERRAPQILNFSRKQRIVKGAGASLPQLNKLLKMHDQMARMMKKLAGNPALASGMMGAMGADGQMSGDAAQDPATLMRGGGLTPEGLGGLLGGGLGASGNQSGLAGGLGDLAALASKKGGRIGGKIKRKLKRR